MMRASGSPFGWMKMPSPWTPSKTGHRTRETFTVSVSRSSTGFAVSPIHSSAEQGIRGSTMPRMAASFSRVGWRFSRECAMRRVAILSMPATISADKSALESSASVPEREGPTAGALKQSSMRILRQARSVDARLERRLFIAGVVRGVGDGQATPRRARTSRISVPPRCAVSREIRAGLQPSNPTRAK